MASYQSTVLVDNPVMYLRFEETSGSNCADTTGNGHTGTANGTFTRNVAMGLAGIDIGITLGGTTADFVSVPSSAALDISGAVTYEAWIKPSSLPTAGEIIARGYVDSTHHGYDMYLDNTGTIFLTDAFFGGIFGQTAAGAISANTLYHVAITCSDPNGGAYVSYVNGSQSASGTSQARPIGTPISVSLCIGATSHNGVMANPFPGTIDEVAVYNSVLSSTRIAAHYAARNTATNSAPGRQSSPWQLVAAMAHGHPSQLDYQRRTRT